MSSLLHVSPEGTARWAVLALGALRFALAAFFLFLAAKNLLGDPVMAEDFRRFGYSNGFRVATALLQIAAALLLCRAQLAFFGAALLVCILIGAAWSHLRHDPPAALLAPLAFLVPALLLLFAYRPPLLR